MRINALREYDLRRELAKRGKLDEVPLIANDFDEDDEHKLAQQDSERRLHTIPPPTPGMSERGGRVSVIARSLVSREDLELKAPRKVLVPSRHIQVHRDQARARKLT